MSVFKDEMKPVEAGFIRLFHGGYEAFFGVGDPKNGMDFTEVPEGGTYDGFFRFCQQKAVLGGPR